MADTTQPTYFVPALPAPAQWLSVTPDHVSPPDDVASLEDDNATLLKENDELRRQLEDYERVKTELASIRDMIDSLLGGR